VLIEKKDMWPTAGLNVEKILNIMVIKHHTMKTYGRVEVWRHAFLTRILVRCTPWPFYPRS
jgi:hypothetical protein